MDPRKVVNEPTGGGEESRRRPDGRQDPLIGRLVADKYRVLDLVAQGGMGRIYRAEQLPLERVVALKILKPRQSFDSADDTWKKRFLLEAATCARLTHPNTVTLFDYGQIQLGSRSTFFMAMEFVQGRTLADVLRSDGAFDPRRALNIAAEICRSLSEAHQSGIIHRDLKPSNVMLVRRDDKESVKVLDFGVAKVMEDDQESLTQADSVVGSPRYMSPEQIRHLDLDGRSDIYSLGVLLYLMLSGQVPFARDSSVGTLMAHLTEPVPSVKERTGRIIPDAVEGIVRRCLEKAAKDRFPNANALREAIEGVLASLPVEELVEDVAAPQATLPAQVADDPSQTTLSAPTPGPMPIPPAASPASVVPASPVALEPPPKPASQTRTYALLGVAVLLILGVGAAILGGGGEEKSEGPAEPVVEAPAAIPLLAVGSEPPGVEVYEGARLLGVTPLSVPLDRPEQRTLTLKLEGFEAQTLVVEPSTTELARTVTMKKAARATGGGGGKPKPQPQQAPQAPVQTRPKNPDLGIIDER